MSWSLSEVGAAIAKAAPVLGGIIGGPAGSAVGGALSLAASALGVDATPEAIMQAVKDDPDALIRLRELEVQERATLLKWQTAQIQADVEDRKSARQASVDGGDRMRLFWMSLFLFCVAFGLEGAILFLGFAQGISGELVGRVMGTVDTLAVMVGTFWYGTTRSTQNSETMLYHSTPINQQQARKHE